ncbi:hypothetical protein [Streptomyces collinus]|uniref:hypothetical protein n=1 Tax=Streptomyces collinus TaxID=42684 RepID=UPI00340090CB
MAFSPDGAILAGSDSRDQKGDSRFDGVISLWDTTTRKRLATLLAGGNGNGTISIWSVGAHAKIHTLRSPGARRRRPCTTSYTPNLTSTRSPADCGPSSGPVSPRTLCGGRPRTNSSRSSPSTCRRNGPGRPPCTP